MFTGLAIAFNKKLKIKIFQKRDSDNELFISPNDKEISNECCVLFFKDLSSTSEGNISFYY